MSNNIIHPTAFVDRNVVLGKNNYIGPYCYITGFTTIGNNNRFEAHCSIGTPAEHREYMGNNPEQLSNKVYIGNNNIVREFVTINAGTKTITSIRHNNTLLRGTHIGHDVTMEDNCTLSCNVLIGGHCYLMNGVNLGLGSIVHQFVKIGAYAMIGMGSVVTKNKMIFCGEMWYGNPAKYQSINQIGISRNNITQEQLLELNQRYIKL